ncbi:melanoma antigen preferentially expressed in tumors-like isoform X2 [Sorex araneus]|uniref:melanoma antigen preferentially expressed in tumors-like isoform X2 n=1 Tax=Sorex araneus TaxID=42254 RepID=UPI0024338335|nr:melanoma antigen preferentially expressed in tumors-like isoform X2 [Sorex araneus]
MGRADGTGRLFPLSFKGSLFMKMESKIVGTLLEISINNLLRNEPATIHAMEELPIDIFIPLFTSALGNRQKNVLKALVRCWPYHCLHVGTLNIPESSYDILEAMVDGLQFVPAQNSSSGGSKLRILDLRHDPDCEIICSYRAKHSFCFLSCVYSQHSMLKAKDGEHNVMCLGMDSSESTPLPALKTMELLMDLNFNYTLVETQFLSFLKNKIEQSSGSLHLCCRSLQIDDIDVYKNSLQIMDLVCIDRLELQKAHLRDINMLLSQLSHLESLTLIDVECRSCKGKIFKTFLSCLGNLNNLEELNLSFFCLTDQLKKILSVLRPQLDILSLTVCDLSNKDLSILSQSTQSSHLKLLNLSNNQIFWEGSEPFQTLLERVSGTIQYLEINNCQITDSSLTAILPALSSCSHLRVFSFACNSITMSALVSVVRHLTGLKELRYVIYPVPLDCYEQGDVNGNLDQEKVASLHNQLKLLLELAHREDMRWTSLP